MKNTANSIKTATKFDWLKEYQWQKGQSGNPNGRPKEPLKVFAREFISQLTPEAKLRFLKEISKEMVWKMAEGNPPQDIKADVTSQGEKIMNLSPEQIAKINEIMLND